MSTALLLVGALSGEAGAADKVGLPFRIDRDPANYRTGSDAVAGLKDGGFAVTWTCWRAVPFHALHLICGKIYAAGGTERTGTLFIAETTGGRSSVASLDDGGFAVAWSTYDAAKKAHVVMGRRYRADGRSSFPVQLATSVEPGHTSLNESPLIRSLSDGRLVVAWKMVERTTDVTWIGYRARIYSLDLLPLSREIPLSGRQVRDPRIGIRGLGLAARSDGGFVATWSAYNYPWRSYVRARIVDSHGTPAASVVPIAAVATKPSIYGLQLGFSTTAPTANGAGGFIATWYEIDSTTLENRLHGQRFTAAGAPAGNPFRIGDWAKGVVGDYQSVATLVDGRVIVTWSGDAVRGQLFDAIGTSLGPHFRIYHPAPDFAFAFFNDVAAVNDGGFVAIWANHYKQDHAPYPEDRAFAQRFSR